MSNSSLWWKDFFDGLWYEFHQRHIRDDEYESQVEHLAMLLDASPGDKLLDIPCGVGGQAASFAKRGCHVTGIDINPTLLEMARERAVNTGVEVELIEQDMRHYDGGAVFNAAFCVWGSFGYFDDEGNRQQLESVFRSLRPGGKFLLEIYPLETIMSNFIPRDWRRGGDVLAVEERSYNPSDSTISSEWQFFGHGKTESRQSKMRLYTLRELSSLFRSVGFAQPVAFDSVNLGPYSLESFGAWLLAVKPGEIA